jgi:hypothetical protein
MIPLLFRHNEEPRGKIHVDLGDLKDEKARLNSYLQTHLKVEVSENRDKLSVDQAKVSITELHHAVKKFIYQRKLSVSHFTTIEGSTVKINRFKGHEKKDKEKHDKGVHANISQSWGL